MSTLDARSFVSRLHSGRADSVSVGKGGLISATCGKSWLALALHYLLRRSFPTPRSEVGKLKARR